ncbi:MAG TPA: hypothetical protein PK280_07745 [Planctomycetota bacterium]|nr:hypothetical protein [Planctomycetota bacterium]
MRSEAALKALGLPRRTVIRLGALLTKGLSCSEALLEAAGRESPLERLLLSQPLLDGAGALDDQTLSRLASEAGVTEKLALVGSGVERIIALEEELLAQQGWDRDSAEPGSPLAALARAPAGALTAPEPSSVRNDLFPPEEVERLRLAALTSARTEEAVSALRRLACAPIPTESRGDIFIRALAVPEAAVRAEAARLLAGLGLGADVCAALGALASGDDGEKRLAIDRLERLLASRGAAPTTGTDMEMIAALVGMSAALTGERRSALRARMLSALAGAAGVLVLFPERVAEAVRQSLELLSADQQSGSASARVLFAALGERAPELLCRQLRTELDRAADGRTRSFLLAELAALRRSAPGVISAEELAGLLAAGIRGRNPGEFEQQMLGGELFSLPGGAAAEAIISEFGGAEIPARRYFLRLLADLCRFRDVPPESVERAGRVFLDSLKGGSKELRLGVLETMLAADPRLSDGLRGELAAAYLESFGDLSFRTDVELAESTVARMGRPALPLLLDRLAPAWPAAERSRACRMIGGIGRSLATAGKRDASLAAGLLDAERQMLDLATGEFPDRRELALAIAKIAGALGSDRAALEASWRRVETMDIPASARMEAWSYLAAGAAATREMAEEAARALLEALSAREPESLGRAVEVGSGSGRMLELSGEASEFVNSLPAVVRSLVRVALAPAAGPHLGRRVLVAMVNRWKELAGGRRIWGPAAATSMVEGLRDLATSPLANAGDRLGVIRALGLKLSDPPAMKAISEILAADDSSPDLAAPASSAALALLALRDKHGRLPAEDRAEILAALARILGRKVLETATPRSARLRERIAAELFEGLNDEVHGVGDALATLAANPALPEGLRKEIGERLAARRALITRPR